MSTKTRLSLTLTFDLLRILSSSDSLELDEPPISKKWDIAIENKNFMKIIHY